MSGSRSGIEIDLRYIDISEYNKSKVYPVKLFLPQDLEFFNLNNNKIALKKPLLLTGKITLIEYLLGSILVYRSFRIRNYNLQLNTILPLILSAEFVDIFNYTHRTIHDGGFIALYIPIGKDFVKKFGEAFRRYIEVDRETGKIICKSKEADRLIDPKTLLKIITQSYFPRLSMIINPAIRSSNYNRAGYNRLGSIVPFIRRILFEVPKALSILGAITTNTKLVYSGISPRSLDIYIGDYLLAELNRQSNTDRKEGRCILEILLNSFLDYVNDYIKKKLNEGYNVNADHPVLYHYDNLIGAIYIGLVELGIHALSHMLLKYLSSITHVSVKNIQELIFINIPLPDTIPTGVLEELSLINAVVDGYIFKNIGDLNRIFTSSGVLAIAVIKEPYSYQIVKNIFNEDPYELFSKLVNFIENTTIVRAANGEALDKCYVRWYNNRYPMKTVIHSLIDKLHTKISECKNVEEGKIIEDVRVELEELFDTRNIGSPNEIYWKLYVPLAQVRRYMYRILYKNLAEKYCSNNSSRCRKDYCRKNIVKIVKPYLPAIYASAVPDCFDGCYNCVLTDACSTPSPLVREWIVSKWAMKYLLNFF